MSGHSKWKKIRHQKGAADQKRGLVFSKLLAAISIASREDSNPQFNSRLRAAVEKAKENKVPLDNIERAIKRSSEEKNLEELVAEAYGPEGSAILIIAITDNSNRTISEVKKILSNHNAKWAEPGSVKWAFEQSLDKQTWQAKFPQDVSGEAKQKIRELIEGLEEHSDIQNVYTNAQLI